MIATQHHVIASATELPDLKTCVTVGKTSRIQDGYLVHTHAQPCNKYEGVHFVVANCKLRRCTGTSSFELLGEPGMRFLETWNETIHQQVCQENKIEFFSNPRTTFRVQTKKTRWFKYEDRRYLPVLPSTIHTEANGFAVIMTRGPWFHASKRNVHTTWHLVEWISV
jgi:hypothetical protein